MLTITRTAPASLLLASVTLIALTMGCAVQQEAEKGQAEKAASADAGGRSDVHSFAKPHEIAVDHLTLDIAIDFDTRQVAGRASLRLVHHAPAEIAWFDVRDLDIANVYLDDSTTPVEFKLTKEIEMHGQGLKVPVTADTEWVHIDYTSSPEAAALQWLEPRQTSGDYPFLLSQGQAILTRSWVPCQDSPGVRMTYDATVKVPEGMMALMSATNPTELNPAGVYTFKMEQPIPSYLMAIAVGQLEFRALDGRTGVYAEPSVIEKAAWEIEETPTMLARAEELYGPYRWDRYDVIFLPSSFPFGGMENPRLTFATPTILAGDRSLVALIAHELAHSWSGNLVTNATWDDFWLNEGFTVYFERRIMEALSGRAYSEMLSLIGEQDLEGSLADLEPRDQHLYLDLAGRDPDDGMTDVAYDKGYLFLRTLEEHFGRERWDSFLRDYFDRFAFKPMTTATFIDHLKGELEIDDAVANEIQLDAWIFGPGIPSNRPDIQSDAFSQVDAELARWVGGESAKNLDTSKWVSHQWQHFLRSLPEGVGSDKLAELDAAFGFSASGNSEVLNDWLVQAIRNNYEPAYPALDKFLTGMGRRKFLKPLYTELAKTEEGLARAKEIYSRARSGYHSVSTGTIDGILEKS